MSEDVSAIMAAAQHAQIVQRDRHAVITLTFDTSGIVVRGTATHENAQGRLSHRTLVGWDEIMAGRVNAVIAAIDVVASYFPKRIFKARVAS